MILDRLLFLWEIYASHFLKFLAHYSFRIPWNFFAKRGRGSGKKIKAEVLPEFVKQLYSISLKPHTNRSERGAENFLIPENQMEVASELPWQNI
jgi:hypothetical protein